MKNLNHYFDYAAATPLDESVEAAMSVYARTKFYNPSALYLPAQEVRADINEARARVGRVLGVQSSRITFTAGITEANNIFLQGMAYAYPNSHMIISSIEHESVVGVVEHLADEGIIEYDVVPVDANGRIDTKELFRLVRPTTIVMSFIHAHNEFGTIQDMRTIAHIRDSIRAERKEKNNRLPIMLHTDAAQSPNYLSMKVESLGVDAMSMSAAKMYGPKQVGVLYTSKDMPRIAFIAGGGQEHGLRAGTENAAGIIGFAAALEYAQKQRIEEVDRLKKLQDLLEEEIGTIPEITLHKIRAPHIPSLTSIHIEGKDGERLVMELDEAGFQLGTGSACNAGSGEPSNSLLALGLSSEEASSSLRIAMGRYTTEASVRALVKALKELV